MSSDNNFNLESLHSSDPLFEKPLNPSQNNEWKASQEQIFCCICNITKNTIINLKAFSEITNKTFSFSSYDEGRDYFLSFTSNPPDKERIADFTDRDRLTSSFLQGNSRQRIQFQQTINNKPLWLELAVFLSRTPESKDIIAFMALGTSEEKNHYDVNSLNSLKKDKSSRINLLAHINHDTRTELNNISGIINLAKDNNISPENMHSYLEHINNSCQILASIFNDITDILQIESGVFEIRQESYSFSDFSNLVLIPAVSHFKNKNIFFKCNMKDSFPTLMIDRQRFNQVFYNLFAVLQKNTNGGEEISLSIEDKKVKNDLFIADFVISTPDTIFTDEEKKNIQELFKIESLPEIYKCQILGVWMVLVKTYVFLLNGKIKFLQDKKKGINKIIISLSMPLAKTAFASTEKPQYVEEYSNLEGKTVLLVEDNYLNREICCRQLTIKKMNVIQAVDGQDALKIFTDSKPGTFNAILMDIQMPVMNGYEATKAIRSLARPDALSTPIIAMSADGFLGNIKESLSIGMVAHLTKPVNPDKLYGTLAAFCTN